MEKLIFRRKLQTLAHHVLIYEEPELRSKALRIIPVDELKKKANEACQKSRDGEGEEEDEADCLLMQLATWYKEKFFSWLSKPECPSCKVTSERRGIAQPMADELRWGATNIELYQCPKCEQHVRFPRYNHPEKLMETRTGRCGEWANCFTFFCRTLGYDARYVIDWTDHVWTEVYSEAKQCWVHFDSCGAIRDRPLLYEKDWGKKLNYIIAFSIEEVVDVTWRYTRKYAEVLKNRTLVCENWLINTLRNMTNERQKKLSPQRREILKRRTVEELVGFLHI